MGQTKEIMSIRADTRVGSQCNENIRPCLGSRAHTVPLSQAGHTRAGTHRAHKRSRHTQGTHAQLAYTGHTCAAVTRAQPAHAGHTRAAGTHWAHTCCCHMQGTHAQPAHAGHVPNDEYCRKSGCLTQYFSLGSCTRRYSHSKRHLGTVCIYNVYVAIAPGKGAAYSDHVFCNILAFTRLHVG